MKCKQVDDLLFSYCDLREIPPMMLRELEEHLQECPECRRKAEFTAREREALVYDGDIPEMSPDFVQRVLAAVAQEQTVPAPSRKTTIWSQIGSRGWWAIGMVAVVVIALLIAPDSFKNPVQTPNTEMQIMESERQPVAMLAGKMPQQQEQETASEPVRIMPEHSYKERVPSLQIGRGNQSATYGSPPAGEQVVVFSPSYIPEDYRLVRVESDAENNITIYYENDRDGYICLRAVQKSMAGMAAHETTADMDTVEGYYPLARYNLQADAATDSEPTVIRWSTEHDGQHYQLELTGSLSPEELIRVANSVK
ncbi:MAG: DUF4367 domain-containing protein [Syntrophomonadaceae bacterium]|nr:DUF4367 domain-containing protein [Syntrophomonadaceae bacterium]